MSATQGRPYCLKAKSYILKEDQPNTKLTKQCCSCGEIIYVGCSGFSGTGKGDKKVYDWIRWWYHDIPYPEKEKQDPTCPDEKAHRTILKKPGEKVET